MKQKFKLKPDWYTLNQDQLKRYNKIGLVCVGVGVFILVIFLPTINFLGKLFGALILGYGANLVWYSHNLLKKDSDKNNLSN